MFKTAYFNNFFIKLILSSRITDANMTYLYEQYITCNDFAYIGSFLSHSFCGLDID